MWKVNCSRKTATFALCSLITALLPVAGLAQTHSPIIGAEQSASGLSKGELLLTESNCMACHQATGPARDRLAAKTAPHLGAGGLSLTPQFLRAFISNPQQEKPGTTMPDLLHGLSKAEKTETIDALVHYLLASGKPGADLGVGADSLKIQQGRALYHQAGCVACHAPQESAAALKSGSSTEQAAGNFTELTNSSVPLGNLAIKMTVPELAKFLMDPLKVRPAGRMPSLNLTETEAHAIAMYLLRDQAAKAPGGNKRISGLSYEYFEGSFTSAAKLDPKKLKGSGTIDGFKLSPKKQTQNIGFRFTGFIKIPQDGSYTFYSYSDDGSRLSMDGKLVVDNDAVHGPEEKSGTVDLKAGEHIIQVAYFNAGAGAELKVSIAGPGLRKQELPGTMLSTDQGTPMEPLNPEHLAVDSSKAARGKELFASIGCAACHQVESGKLAQIPGAKGLLELNPSAGCLNNAPGPRAAKYELSDEQRAALRQTIAGRDQLAKPRTPKEQVAFTMTALNCFACHGRDGSGGPSSVRAEYFTVIGEADLGDEGRLPPHLTKVGDKLRPEWTREVLTRKGAVRPYMATRMPQFGAANVEFLADAFQSADSTGSPDSQTDLSHLKYGRKLAGTEGLSCISCHTFAEHKSLGIPAIDLTLMTKRLKKDWFARYLLDPASLRPGTRMPTFWPEGKSARKDILEGDTSRQIDALWAYLGKTKETGLPTGLIQGKMEVVATDEAVLYRNFIDGGGSRAIGVGYPEKANLAFDANDLRLAMIWQGPFIDAARHRNGRGEGFEKPLGYNVIRMPAGMPFAILDDPGAKWPEASSRSAGYKMEGYQLDEKRRPAFHYSYQGVQVEDYPVAVAGDTDPSLRRTLILHTKNPVANLWFRAWSGAKIDEQGDGTFVADGRLRIKFQADAKPVLRREGGRSELLVPIQFKGSEARLVEDLVW